MKSKKTCLLTKVECGSSADGTVPLANLPVEFTGLFTCETDFSKL